MKHWNQIMSTDRHRLSIHVHNHSEAQVRGRTPSTLSGKKYVVRWQNYGEVGEREMSQYTIQITQLPGTLRIKFRRKSLNQ